MNRFKEDRENRGSFSFPTRENPILIVCPKCSGKASIVPYSENEVKATCFHCGFSESKSTSERACYWYEDNPTDGFFEFDLWLTSQCNGHPLWAFNLRHLEYLEDYISAELRERSRDEKLGWSNSSLSSRLPKWMKSAKNRDDLLKAIAQLKAKA
ncbi:hypothetical protein ACFOEK_19975 [Litoribrevibacter euphylliae]|uniref:TFIIB-type zinc ribbon-containing protein n=1 Tax=Litoribrevibacter euphylliae TaxID=1834034 RepID=A0ABV7HHJ6_9GAMM